MQWWNWLTVITWVMLTYSILSSVRTWRRLAKQDRLLEELMDTSRRTLDRYLAICMKIAKGPVRQSERDPACWSIDVDPDLLAAIQHVDQMARSRGASVVKVESE